MIAALLAMVIAASPAAPPRDVLWLTVEDDLDSVQLAADVERAISRTDAEAVVVRLECRRWRRDVVWRIGRAVHDCHTPVHVILDGGPDKSIGLGGLLVGLCADSVELDPAHVIRHDPGDDLAETAPPDVDHEKVERELEGMLWSSLRARAIDTNLAAALVNLDRPVWCLDFDGLKSLAFEPPADGVRLIDVRADGTGRCTIPGALANQLGLTSGKGSVAAALDEAGPWREVRRSLASGLNSARTRLTRGLENIERDIREVDRRLDRIAHPIDDRVVPAAAYREGGQWALARIAEAASRIDQLERLFADYPELLNLPSPRGTSVGRTPARNHEDWRYLIIDWKRDLQRLTERAEVYASR